MTFSFAPARAAASRSNGAKSRGPKSPEGKARSAQNALKHGFRAQKHVVLPAEDGAEFAVHEAALMDELAPEGALQTVLARRIVAATWRLERAERIEAELFAENHYEGGGLGLALIRDCNRARAFETLVRYRGGTLAEFWRALRTLKALQAERAARAGVQAPAQPDKPETCGNRGESEPPRPAENGSAGEAAVAPPARSCHPSPGARSTRRGLPNEPEARRDAGLSPPDLLIRAGSGRPHAAG